MTKQRDSVILRRGIIAATALLGIVFGSPTQVQSLSRDYMCFFDPDSAEPSSRCQLIMLEFVRAWEQYRRGAARDYRNGEPLPAQTFRVEIEGHADRTERDGRAVSAARARVGAAFLRLNGIPAELITEHAHGSDRLLIPTDRPEQQNRRFRFVMR